MWKPRRLALDLVLRLDTLRKIPQPLAGFGVGQAALAAMPKPLSENRRPKARTPMKSDDDEEDEEAEGF